MPEEAQAPTAEPTAAAPSAPDTSESADAEPTGNEWLRETAQGLIYSRSLDTAKQSQEWSEANAELRRGRRNGQPGKPEGEPTEGEDGKAQSEAPPRSKAASGETDDAAFHRRVQAEVDRREAVRRQRAESQQERDLRQRDPQAYAQLKEQQEQQNSAAESLGNAMRGLALQFDEAAVKPLMDALADADRNQVLSKASGVHGIPQRKLMVEEGLKALKKAAYDEGFAKGKDSAQKSLRRNSAFRKELLAEARGGDDEPELNPGNGTVGEGGDWDMNDWMRTMTGRKSGGQS